MNQKGLINIVLIIVALIGTGIYFISTRQTISPPSVTTPSPTPTPSPSPKPSPNPSPTTTIIDDNPYSWPGQNGCITVFYKESHWIFDPPLTLAETKAFESWLGFGHSYKEALLTQEYYNRHSSPPPDPEVYPDDWGWSGWHTMVGENRERLKLMTTKLGVGQSCPKTEKIPR